MIIRKGLVHAVLSHLARAIDRHASIPALSHVKLDSDGDTLRLTATDLTTTVVAAIPCQGRVSTCLPAAALRDFVKPDDAKDKQSLVELLPEGEGKITVAVEAALTTMPTLPVADFPLRPGDTHAARDWRSIGTWGAADLADALTWITKAVGTDETRRHLCGVLFEKDQIVGLDGHRLHLVRMPGVDGDAALLPGKTIAALVHMAPKSGDIIATRAKDVVRFTFSTGSVHWEIETRVMEEKFPPYEQVIPKCEIFTAVLERDRLATALAKVAAKRSSRTQGVRTKWNGALTIERDDEGGRSSATVPFIETSHTGDDTIIGFNSRYLIDAVSAGDENVTARVGGQLDPLRLDLGDGRVAVLMPMRL